MSDPVIDRVIPELELARYTDRGDLASRARGLLRQQKDAWPTLRQGYASLDTVKTRSFDFDGFAIRVQFNPGRLTSSSAKVDPKSISERTCFLCPWNLPAEQRALSFDGYLVLCNPFPIFPEHFTISLRQHTPQQIRLSFQTLLNLSREMQRHYAVLYNGPRCGASAPDHLHFQAGNKRFMPIDDEYEAIRDRFADRLAGGNAFRAYSVETYLRRFISLESRDNAMIVKAFEMLYDAFRGISAGDEEPMMNILSSYDNDEWRVILFPRAKHRPSFFFLEGDQKILISPAAVDLGGVCITPLERDFERITRENIVQMFDEVSLSKEAFERLKDHVALVLSLL